MADGRSLIGRIQDFADLSEFSLPLDFLERGTVAGHSLNIDADQLLGLGAIDFAGETGSLLGLHQDFNVMLLVLAQEFLLQVVDSSYEVIDLA